MQTEEMTIKAVTNRTRGRRRSDGRKKGKEIEVKK